MEGDILDCLEEQSVEFTGFSLIGCAAFKIVSLDFHDSFSLEVKEARYFEMTDAE